MSYIPDFAFQLVDLSHIKSEEIKGHIIGQITLQLVKAVSEGKILEYLDRADEVIGKILYEENSLNFFSIIA